MAKHSFRDLLTLLGMTQTHLFENFDINHLRMDSRQIKLKDVFVAISGITYKGQEFIPEAINNGASAILAETAMLNKHLDVKWIIQGNHRIPCIYIFNLSKKLSLIASDFYDTPSEKLTVIGVTGTNGKTTVTQLLAQLATRLNIKSAVLGTIGNGIYQQLKPSVNTTASAVDIQTMLSEFVTQEVKMVAMEMSSQGLAMNRVTGLSCSATVFTNLTHDHLDYHKNMDNYAEAKWSLFSSDLSEKSVKKSGKNIINYDDGYGKAWLKKLDDPTIVSIIPDKLSELKNLKLPYVGTSHIEFNNAGVTINIESSWGNATIHSHLLGEFNVSNLLLTIATLLTLDFSFTAITNQVSSLLPICGRMEVLKHTGQPTVIVDYAHTPDALEKAIKASRIHCLGTLFVVFGCGGDRDKGKRSEMGKVAELYADSIIITNDNPRKEDEYVIIEQIQSGISAQEKIKVITDRSQAIYYAITQATEQDVILIAGKGHEDYQIIGDKKFHSSDQEIVMNIFNTGKEK